MWYNPLGNEGVTLQDKTTGRNNDKMNATDHIPPALIARIKERLDEYKAKNPNYLLELSEVEFGQLIDGFYKQESKKYLAERMGW